MFVFEHNRLREDCLQHIFFVTRFASRRDRVHDVYPSKSIQEKNWPFVREIPSHQPRDKGQFRFTCLLRNWPPIAHGEFIESVSVISDHYAPHCFQLNVHFNSGHLPAASEK